MHWNVAPDALPGSATFVFWMTASGVFDLYGFRDIMSEVLFKASTLAY